MINLVSISTIISFPPITISTHICCICIGASFELCFHFLQHIFFAYSRNRYSRLAWRIWVLIRVIRTMKLPPIFQNGKIIHDMQGKAAQYANYGGDGYGWWGSGGEWINTLILGWLVLRAFRNICNLDTGLLSSANMLKLLKDKVRKWTWKICQIATTIYFPAVPDFCDKGLNTD